MKTSTRMSFAALTIIVIVAGLCLSACPHKEDIADDNDKRFFLKIGHPDRNGYADVKSQDDFDAALIKVKNHGGDFKIRYLCKEGANAQDPYNPEHHEPCDKTAQAVGSEAADRVAAGDPNATQHVRADSPQDLQAVLATFVEPSPTRAPSR
jgi:hypothetical protein